MRAPSFAGVILAAGESSRMGRDKALLSWKGQTFVQAHLDLLRQHSELVIVVAGKNFSALEPAVYATGGFLVRNPTPELGQFSSLQIGLREVLNRGRDAALIALVDRPPCKNETVGLLKERFQLVYAEQKWAVVPEFQGKHGHPILVGREMIEAFFKAPPASSAREIEHSVADKIDYFPVSDPAVAVNVDTPEDYERLKLQISQN
jgi:molybdenum cofactor cytidylyltransferase